MAHRTDSTRQSFQAQYAKWVTRRRWLVISATLILICFAAYGGLFLKLSTDYRIFFDEDNPQLLTLEALEDTYGKSDSVIFMLDPNDSDALSENALNAAVWLTEEAWQIPYSRRVDSLSNFQHTTADGDDIFVSDLVNPNLLSDPREQDRIRVVALSDPRLVGKLVSHDGRVSAVQVTLAMPEENTNFAVLDVSDYAYDLAAEAEHLFSGIDVRVAGTVLIHHHFSTAAIDSQKIFLPLSLLVMAIALALLTRSFSGVIATGFVMIFSVVASMGLGGWIGLQFSPPTAPAPTIVLMIVVANAVHLLVTLQQRLQAGAARLDAIEEAIRVNLYPIFLASATTALGFLSMNFAEVPPHRHLGTFVAFGILASFVLTVSFLPALLSLLPMRTPHKRREDDPLMTAIANFVVRRRKLLLYGSMAAVMVFAAFIPRNELNDVLAHFFDESVEFRQDLDFLDERLSGNTMLEYSLVSEEHIAAPAFLSDVSAFAEWLRAQPDVRNVSVITDTFREINKNMNGGDPDAYRLPENRELAFQYLLLYELSLPFGFDLNNQISFDKLATRVTVNSKTLSSRETIELNQRAENWLAVNAASVVQATGTGPALLFAHIGQRNIQSMLVGTVIVLLSICAILLAAFRSIRLGLVSLVPNFVPAIVGFGVWGLIVGEVGASLSVVVAMTIGIVVDDTVHFLNKFRSARRELGLSAEDAVIHAFQTVGRAVLTTTAVLVAGFLILLFSPFIPTAQVGLLTAIIIGAAMVFDFLLLPPLLIAVERLTGKDQAVP